MILTKEHLQLLINEFLSKLGNQSSSVSVEIVSDPKILAGARGVKLLNIPLGAIYINKILLDKLSSEEVKFILAHEAVHIDPNHLPLTILIKLPKTLLDALAVESPFAKGLSLVWDLIKIGIYQQGGLPPETAITRQQEIQADVWSIILLTGNKTTAMDC